MHLSKKSYLTLRIKVYKMQSIKIKSPFRRPFSPYEALFVLIRTVYKYNPTRSTENGVIL